MHMIINACIGRLQVCVPDSRGRTEPGFPQHLEYALPSALSLESGLLAWQPRGDESVCVCVCVRDGGQQTGDHSAQTADEEKDIWQVQVSASLTHARTHARTHTCAHTHAHTHTHTHTHTGWRQAALGFTVTCYTILRLPALGSNACTSRRPGWRESGLPSIQIPIRNTQSHVYTAYWRWLHNQPTMHSGMRATTITHYFTRVWDAMGLSRQMSKPVQYNSHTHTHCCSLIHFI